MSSRIESSPDASDGQPVLVLASQSAQRRELLRQIGFEPWCLPANVDETPLEDEAPAALVRRLAHKKAVACAESDELAQDSERASRCVVVGADTVIDLDGQTLGKPRDQAHAVQMLQALSDREHRVHSGVCVLETNNGRVRQAVVTTSVRFGIILESSALRYWLTGEPVGKAGSYAIQGLGAQFVASLSGSYSNVVGLPLFEITELLAQAGVPCLNPHIA